MCALEANLDPNFNGLDPDHARHLLSGLYPQMGIGLDFSDGTTPDEVGYSQPDAKKQLLPPNSEILSIEVDQQILSLTGLAELVKLLRNQILELNTISYSSVSYRGQYFYDSRSISVKPETASSLLSTKESILKKYITCQVRIKLLLQAIDALDERNKQDYTEIRDGLRNWQAILNEILPQLDRNDELQARIAQEVSKQEVGKGGKAEVDRLVRLLSGERAGIKQAQLKVRVMRLLTGSTAPAQKEQVATDVVEELFTTASIINDIRIIDKLKGEDIDLYQLRKLVAKINEEYQQDPSRVDELNKVLIDEVAIPIANTVAELFPHVDDNSPTLVASALFRNEAICAGKAEIYAIIFKLLGFVESRSSLVMQTFDNLSSHTIFSADLLGGRKLLIDGNYKVAEDQSELSLANEKMLDPQAAVYVYTAKRIDSGDAKEDPSGVFVQNEEKGKKSYYRADIPFPHPSTDAEKVANFSSSAHFNYAFLLTKAGKVPEAIQHYKRATEINPNEYGAHYFLGKIFTKAGKVPEAIQHYKRATEINPSFDKAHFEVGKLYLNAGNKIQALLHFNEVVKINPKYPFINVYLEQSSPQPGGNLPKNS